MNMVEEVNRLCGLKYEFFMTVLTGKAEEETGVYFLHSEYSSIWKLK